MGEVIQVFIERAHKVQVGTVQMVINARFHPEALELAKLKYMELYEVSEKSVPSIQYLGYLSNDLPEDDAIISGFTWLNPSDKMDAYRGAFEARQSQPVYMC